MYSEIYCNRIIPIQICHVINKLINIFKFGQFHFSKKITYTVLCESARIALAYCLSTAINQAAKNGGITRISHVDTWCVDYAIMKKLGVRVYGN